MEKKKSPPAAAYSSLKRQVRKVPIKLKLKKRGLSDWGDKYPTINLNQDVGGPYRRSLPSNKITTTKYTVLNFIPKNIFEQFRRMTNVYFLLIVCITLIPAISPLNPWTSILPLAFVLGVAAIKEGYEDFVSSFKSYQISASQEIINCVFLKMNSNDSRKTISQITKNTMSSKEMEKKRGRKVVI